MATVPIDSDQLNSLLKHKKMPPNKNRPVHSLLLITKSCPYCDSTLKAFTSLIKEGEIGRLEVVNVGHYPEIAEETGARSLPWMRIGSFELTGLRSLEELRKWAQRARNTSANQSAYLSELINTQRLDSAINMVHKDKDLIHDLVDLMSDPEIGLSTRIGIDAIFEDLLTEDAAALDRIIPSLSALTGAPEPQIRADACYYLGLTKAPSSIEYVRSLLKDVDPDVREIAADTLALIQEDANI